MKNFTFIIAFFVAITTVMAQSVPVIQAGERTLGVKKIDIEVQIVGNVATTTYDMYFYNPTDQILEGELNFPLGEGQKVVRYALDVNGSLREAVVVEKEKGRVAFEAVVRRRVDPALLEQGTGNNYKSRIYPIPANGYKRVLLAFEQVVPYQTIGHVLAFENSFENLMERYELKVKVHNSSAQPILNKNGKATRLTKKDGGFIYNDVAVNSSVNNAFKLTVPQVDAVQSYLFDNKAYIYKTLNRLASPKKLPNSLAIFWDSSLSMKDRDLQKELNLLNQYLSNLGAIQIELITFSNTLMDQKKFVNSTEGRNQLVNILKKQVYDGATSFDWITDVSFSAQEVLLFSDGLNTHSDLTNCLDVPLYAISSSKAANFDALKQLASCTGGDYINLSKTTTDEGFRQLTQEALYFMGAYQEGNDVVSFPVKESLVNNDFGVALEDVTPGAVITLNFGTKKSPKAMSVQVMLPTRSNGSEMVQQRWANLKIDALLAKGEESKAQVIALAKLYGIITPHTSLIVLETAQDYADYQIEPPVELKKEYDRLVAQNSQSVFDNSEETEALALEEAVEVQATKSAPAGPLGTMVTVSGTLTDDSGLPLPGVNIIVAGTATGTQSDFDGNYSIQAGIGEVLVFSYVGFSTLESDVLGNGDVSIRMQPNSQLDEVVIVAQGMKREKKSLGFGVSEVTAKDIEGRSESDIARVLSGKASGVAVTNQSGMSGSSTNVIIRGYNSITGSNQALIIVDGVPFSNDTNTRGSFITGNNGGSRLADLDPNLIHDVKVLKGLAATTLYGSAGRNGVILITTKSQATGRVNTGSSNATSSSNSAVNEDENIDPRILELRTAKTYAQKSIKPAYVTAIKSQSSVDDMYDLYLQLRPENLGNPAFFIDVFDVLYKKNSKMAIRILSNLGELDLDNYEMLKALGYKYEAIKNYNAASFVYKKVLELRPEDSQSYRDLALVYANLGKTQEVEKLIAGLKDESFYSGNRRRRFEGFHQVLNTELLGALNTSKIKTAGYDLRVVIDWNHNDTDIDLHIIDPNNEECYFSHPDTEMGGKMSSDMTQGFGPEQFVLANAKRGTYFVSLDYYGDSYQKVDRPTYLKVTIFKNYGRPNQTQEIQVIHLDSEADEALLAKIKI